MRCQRAAGELGMVEGEATQEPSAPVGAPASPSDEHPVETQETSAQSAEAEGGAAPEAVVASESAATETPVAALDWSHLRGFQAVEPPSEETAARDDYAQELVKELSA